MKFKKEPGSEEMTLEIMMPGQPLLKFHVERDHEGIRYKCEECEQLFTDQKTLRNHFKKVHEGFDRVCGVQGCAQEFETSDDLIEHLKKEHNLKPKICLICNFKAYNKQALSVHVKSIHKGMRLQCDEEGCNKSFDQNGQLNYHKKVNHTKYSCDQCDFQATTPGYLSTHVKRDHEGIRYNCEVCGKLYTDPKNLRKHTIRGCEKL